MQIGDSILLKTQNEVNNLIWRLRRFGKNATQRKVSGGYRVWYSNDLPKSSKKESGKINAETLKKLLAEFEG